MDQDLAGTERNKNGNSLATLLSLLFQGETSPLPFTPIPEPLGACHGPMFSFMLQREAFSRNARKDSPNCFLIIAPMVVELVGSEGGARCSRDIPTQPVHNHFWGPAPCQELDGGGLSTHNPKGIQRTPGCPNPPHPPFGSLLAEAHLTKVQSPALHPRGSDGVRERLEGATSSGGKRKDDPTLIRGGKEFRGAAASPSGDP